MGDAYFQKKKKAFKLQQTNQHVANLELPEAVYNISYPGVGACVFVSVPLVDVVLQTPTILVLSHHNLRAARFLHSVVVCFCFCFSICKF